MGKKTEARKLTIADIIYKGSYNCLKDLSANKKAVLSTSGVNSSKVIQQLTTFNASKPFVKITFDSVAESTTFELLPSAEAKGNFERLFKIAKSVFEPSLDW